MKKFSLPFLFSLLSILIFFGLFKIIRTFFPIPEIASNKLVGYSQYFGYPIYFDAVFFLLIIIFPLLIFRFFKNKNE